MLLLCARPEYVLLLLLCTLNMKFNVMYMIKIKDECASFSCLYVDDDFDEYDKPGAERSRRRRGEDDDDLER